MELQEQVYYDDIAIDDRRVRKRRKKNNVRRSRRNTVSRNRTKVLTKAQVKAKKKSITKKMVLISVGLVNLFLIVTTLYGYITMSNAGLQVAKLESEISELEAQKDYYRMEIEKYSSAERVEKIARDKLAMYYPDDSNFYYIEKENNDIEKDKVEVAKLKDGLKNEKERK